MKPRKFKIGQRVRVLGDSARWRHNFAMDTECEITENFTSGDTLGYGCHGIDTRGDDARRYVAEQDLELTVQPVTEEDLEYIRRSFGVEE